MNHSRDSQKLCPKLPFLESLWIWDTHTNRFAMHHWKYANSCNPQEQWNKGLNGYVLSFQKLYNYMRPKFYMKGENMQLGLKSN
jgi:hypothetical protein